MSRERPGGPGAPRGARGKEEEEEESKAELLGALGGDPAVSMELHAETFRSTTAARADGGRPAGLGAPLRGAPHGGLDAGGRGAGDHGFGAFEDWSLPAPKTAALPEPAAGLLLPARGALAPRQPAGWAGDERHRQQQRKQPDAGEPLSWIAGLAGRGGADPLAEYFARCDAAAAAASPAARAPAPGLGLPAGAGAREVHEALVEAEGVDADGPPDADGRVVATAYRGADRARFAVTARGGEARFELLEGCPVTFARARRRAEAALLARCGDEEGAAVALVGALELDGGAAVAGLEPASDEQVREGVAACLPFAGAAGASASEEGLRSLARLALRSARHARAVAAAGPRAEAALVAGLRSRREEPERLAALTLREVCAAGEGASLRVALEAACDTLGAAAAPETRRLLARALAEAAERSPDARPALAAAKPVVRDLFNTNADTALFAELMRLVPVLGLDQ